MNIKITREPYSKPKKDKRKICPTCGNDFACCGILRTEQHLFKKDTTFSVCSCIKCGTEWEFEIK